MRREEKKPTLSDIQRIVRETRRKAEASSLPLDEECAQGKCKHQEHKAPRTRGAKGGQRRPRDVDQGFEDGVGRLEDGG